ncbi:MAG: DUF3365 domain-containing protein, partial [Spirochaetia bacterium]|nr:DUF3365 domain-containing protein [Spirochaetia bacterium]
SAMKSGMMKVLFEQVEKKGFADSVKYCSDFAPEGGKTLNQKLSEKFKNELNLKNFSFRRTSLKYRNPNNAPDELEKKVLTSWIDLYNDGKEIKPHIEPAANGYRVLVPMLVPTVTCLGCHGTPDSIDSEAVKVIDELYPEDKAKGFVVGDLRGAISLQIEK